MLKTAGRSGTIGPAMNTPPKTRIERWFDDYAASHRHPGNKLCHSIGIPLIAISLMGMLSRWNWGPPLGMGSASAWIGWDAGLILWALAGAWYLTLDWKLALPYLLFALGWYGMGKSLPLGWQLGLFAVGWIFQGVGHRVFEKNSPAFFSNVRHLLIGPFWLFATWIGYPRTAPSEEA